MLTDVSIKKLKPGPARREVHDGRGLYLIIQPSGAKSFAFRYKFGGRTAKLTFGPAELGLAAARKLAASALFDLAQGKDPGEAKRSARRAEEAAAADTLKAVCDEYLKREGSKLRTGNRQGRDLARLIYPRLGTRPIAEIKRSELIRLLDRIEDENGAVQSDAMLALLSRIFTWHAARSDDFRSPIVKSMRRTKPNARERVLTDDELRAIWKSADATVDPIGRVLQVLLLTGARRNEVAHMRWAEIDGEGNWTLPAARHKLKTDLTRPLSEAAREVISRVPKIVDCEHVFSEDGARKIGSISTRKARFAAASGTAGWTIHDLRRTSRSLMSRAGVPVDVAERCLGHTITGVRGVYDRHQYRDEMLRGFESLAALISRVINPPSDNVLPIKAQG
ncbi:MAG: tyrosine-type recombinase/integrase [Xanthobacteraceae bacterium]